MSGFRADGANRAGLHINNANLTGASISHARIEAMAIDGINVLGRGGKPAGAVKYESGRKFMLTARPV